MNKRKYILFFNGWAIEDQIIAHLSKTDFELTIIPFSPENQNNSQIVQVLKEEKEIYLIAFSLGVYQAHLFLQAFPYLSFKKKIAINGTSFAIDSKQGIFPIIFKKTLENLSEKNMEIFYKNIGYEYKKEEIENWKFYQDDLAIFAQNYTPLKNQFSHAIVSQQDSIFSPKNQKTHHASIIWKEVDTKHNPFLFWKNWQEIIDYPNP